MDQNTLRESTTSKPRVSVASYPNYAEAQRAVDYLSDEKFSVEHTAIVAEGLRFVEEVTGRLNYGRAILSGAMSGATVGLFIGLFFGLFSIAGALLNLLATGIIIGAVVGALAGLIGFALSGGRRDFTSVGKMQAERYNIMVDAEVADEAMRLLEGMR